MSAPEADVLCGVLLHPAGHTLSPVLHGEAYRELGLRARYEVFDVPAERLAASLAELRARGVRQLSVSLPHKERALALADAASPAARAIGAANTLTRAADGSLHADNTDWLGVLRALEPHGSLEGARARVLGAGGAARAAVYALLQMGAAVAIANRTRERAERVARELGCVVDVAGEPYDVLVNATSVGMQPHTDGTPLAAAELLPGALVFDLVYRPLETRLLREARARGCRTQDGLAMLVHQAVEQVRLWSGRAPDPAGLRRSAERALGV